MNDPKLIVEWMDSSGTTTAESPQNPCRAAFRKGVSLEELERFLRQPGVSLEILLEQIKTELRQGE